MQVEEITQILRESPSVRLIKSRSVDFFLSFVIEAFEGQAAIMQERLHMLLENRLDEQENSKHSASCVFFSPLFLPTFVASL